MSLFLGDNSSLNGDYLKDVRIQKDLSMVRYLNLGCVNIPSTLFSTHTQEAKEERILTKQI